MRNLYAFMAAATLCLAAAPAIAAADDLDRYDRRGVASFLELARACRRAYDDDAPGMVSTPSGCVATIGEDGQGNLIIAFRGSTLEERNPAHPFSSFGGANLRRNYRDWAATNLKQVTGFLPRQYVEAAELVRQRVLAHPPDKLVVVTGHSKGGGAAAYAAAAAVLSPATPAVAAARVRAVTFNAAVVREGTWRRLIRLLDRDADGAPLRDVPDGFILSVCMRGDPVSALAAAEERRWVRRLVVNPPTDLPPLEQHGIGTVIDVLEHRLRERGREEK